MNCIEQLIRLMDEGIAEASALRCLFFESRYQVLVVPAGEIVKNHLRQHAENALIGDWIDKTRTLQPIASEGLGDVELAEKDQLRRQIRLQSEFAQHSEQQGRRALTEACQWIGDTDIFRVFDL